MNMVTGLSDAQATDLIVGALSFEADLMKEGASTYLFDVGNKNEETRGGVRKIQHCMENRAL